MVPTMTEDIGEIWGKVSANMRSVNPHAFRNSKTVLRPSDCSLGSITDYGLSMVQWMQHRQQRCMGGVRMEAERPSPSYVIDVCTKS